MSTDNNTSHPFEIQLTQGFVTIVDAKDADLVSMKWHAANQKNMVYAVHGIKYEKGVRHIRLHRLIMERVLNRPLNPKEIIDHINGNTLDNTRSNLRLASPQQNQFNAKLRKDNLTGYKGVSYHKAKDEFRARIYIDGKLRHLGTFKTAEEAFECYCKKAIQLRGEYVRLK